MKSFKIIILLHSKNKLLFITIIRRLHHFRLSLLRGPRARRRIPPVQDLAPVGRSVRLGRERLFRLVRILPEQLLQLAELHQDAGRVQVDLVREVLWDFT